MNDVYMCPHCETYIEILQYKCCIFRHGIYKHNLEQINPHMSKNDCEILIKNDLIYGCGKPFKIINKIIEKCDYI